MSITEAAYYIMLRVYENSVDRCNVFHNKGICESILVNFYVGAIRQQTSALSCLKFRDNPIRSAA